MSVTSTRLKEGEHTYLQQLANKRKISVSNALRDLVEFAAQNELDPYAGSTDFPDEVRKMIEQIHMAIPHLMYTTRATNKVMLGKLSDDELFTLQRSVLDEMTRRCGDFQTVKYTQNYTAKNKQGLTEMPLDEKETAWKLP